jgi:hypothetical protein
MGRSPSRKLVVPLTILLAFAGGAASHRLWPRDARAQTVTSAATIFVPADGLVFRTFDGKPIAKLSHDATGGVFELYDDSQEAIARLSATVLSAPPAQAPPRAPRPPYVIDEEDPFKGRF